MGPACWDVDMITQLIDAGMNTARLNFSHGDNEAHGATPLESYGLSKLMGEEVLETAARTARASACSRWSSGTTLTARSIRLLRSAAAGAPPVLRQLEEKLRAKNLRIIDLFSPGASGFDANADNSLDRREFEAMLGLERGSNAWQSWLDLAVQAYQAPGTQGDLAELAAEWLKMTALQR